MIAERTDAVTPTVSGPSAPAFVRFRELGERVVVTGIDGDWIVLPRADFRRFAAGAVEPGTPLFEQLSARNMLRDSFDVRRAADVLRRRKRFVHAGPNLHLVVVTLRCNETCVYCHASRANMNAVHTDMTPKIGEKVVDLMLQSTSPSVTRRTRRIRAKPGSCSQGPCRNTTPPRPRVPASWK